ncbi:MAG: dienelactone hydrolase family protein [Spirochaetia bacterium]|nr:dienelactone hydrolase family protein [Spirochaetia bacterium]
MPKPKKSASPKSSGPAKSVQIKVGEHKISVAFYKPASFKRALILANGAGADMKNTFIRTFAAGLCERGICVVTFNFVYQELKRKAPDKKQLLEETYLAVIEKVKQETNLKEPQIALGGKSMGGRISTQIVSRTKCKKVVLLGYPLHPPGQPEKLRDAHLYDIQAELLFISGDRDPFCTFSLFHPILKKLKTSRLIVINNAGHSLDVPKSSEIPQANVYSDCMDEIAGFV